MRKRILFVLPLLLCAFGTTAYANWEYEGVYIGDGVYVDDGSRFTISVRGGASMGWASIKNNVGALSAHYYMDAAGTIYPEFYCGGPDKCEEKGLEYIGYGDVGSLPASRAFEAFAFTAGASVGWTIPNHPQWRVELGWDYIGESEYNASPMFEGNLRLEAGSLAGETIQVRSSAVHSSVSTDIISVMAFYDFFDGLQKPLRTVVPYVGLGIGYADSTTVLNLVDPYGDLSADLDLTGFGTPNEYGVLQFNRSEKSSSNVTGLVALGLSYGLTDNFFVDFGARIAYLPRVKWELRNNEDTRSRDWFSADDMIYANIMLGVRFEF